jgi:hypothetical protein
MMTMGDRRTWTVVALVAALGSASAARAQSLGEVARLERARRAQEERIETRGSAIVRGDDLKRYEATPAPRGSGAGAAAPGGVAAMSGRERSSVSAAREADADESYWDMQLDAARTTVDMAEQRTREAAAAAQAGREQPRSTIYEEALEESDAQQARVAEAEAARRDLDLAREAYAEVERGAREARALQSSS